MEYYTKAICELRLNCKGLGVNFTKNVKFP